MHTPRARSTPLFLLCPALALFGCGVARTVRAPSSVGPPATDLRLVVTDFVLERSTPTSSGSLVVPEAQWLAEPLGAALTTALRRAGWAARTASDATALRDGEVAVRGYLRPAAPSADAAAGGAIVLTAGTLGLVGGLLPYPGPVTRWCTLDFRVEVVDPSGAPVAQRAGTFDVRYGIWHVAGVAALERSCREDEELNRDEALHTVSATVGALLAQSR